jgi:cyanosortase A-associated protein
MQNGLTLAIAVSYVAHPDANVKIFRQYNPKVLSPSDRASIVVRHSQKIGFYRLSVETNRAYLRSCINPRGPSAITYEQFIKNRYTYDLQFSRILPVLLGQEPLRDHRCLWTNLSISTSQVSPELAYQILDKVWHSWYPWWHDRFP